MKRTINTLINDLPQFGDSPKGDVPIFEIARITEKPLPHTSGLQPQRVVGIIGILNPSSNYVFYASEWYLDKEGKLFAPLGKGQNGEYIHRTKIADYDVIVNPL
ncbi:hypothetical protein HYS49_02395 [Candidatus Woesearchaeota archaeon]|nr:hypothetical protein [Candidatus Woesearchaeota archaeon]